MGKSSDAPPAVDPAKSIGAQSAADTTAFNQQTAANRTNAVGPDSSNVWTSTPNFDQAGYDSAVQDWNAQNPNSGGVGVGAPTKANYTTNTWTNTTQLSPQQQQLHDLNQSSQVGQAGLLSALTSRLQGTYANPLDFSSVNNLQSNVSGTPGSLQTNAGTAADQARLEAMDPTQYNQQAADAQYNNSTRYLDPQIQVQQKALEARLGEQGMVPGTPGYQAAMQQFQNTNAQSYQAARDSATLQGAQVGSQQYQNQASTLNSAIAAALQSMQAGNSAQQQGFTQGLNNAALNNSTSAQQLAQLLQERAQPLNELNSVRSGTSAADLASGVPGGSGSSTGAQLNAPNITSALDQQYQQMMDQYNANVSTNNANTGAGASLAGAALMAAAYY